MGCDVLVDELGERERERERKRERGIENASLSLLLCM